ncbi:hypothetical protein [Roseimaritima ulvae]|uniref:hypothetical protein n=1 Tax=Roseimaritima ulvae TaxID=980254 RepID=UPI00082B7390|nr:hypothetical protein [Roseimaritima ulvae]
MNRVVSLLLIPMFLLGQCSAHAHGGSGVSGSETHGQRPHLHVGAISGQSQEPHPRGHQNAHGDEPSHDHGHPHAGVEFNTANSLLSNHRDHDADAIYFAGGVTVSGRIDKVNDPCPVVLASMWCCDELKPSTAVDSASCNPPDRYGNLPIYLQTASLRL